MYSGKHSHTQDSKKVATLDCVLIRLSSLKGCSRVPIHSKLIVTKNAHMSTNCVLVFECVSWAH